MNTIKWIKRNKKKLPEFLPGQSYISLHPQIIKEEGIKNLVEIVFSEEYIDGKNCDNFLQKLQKITGKNYGITASDPDSIGITALMRHTKQRLVIASAFTSPSIINSIIQNQGEICFIDIDPETLNIIPWQLMSMIDGRDIGGIILSPVLGFPYDERFIFEKCREKEIWTFTDVNEMLGVSVCGKLIGTYSNGGGYDRAFLTGSKEIFFDVLDHAYPLYGSKISEFQGAIALDKLDNLGCYIKKRNENYKYLRDSLASLDEYFQFIKILDASIPCPLGFPIIVRPNKYMPRKNFARYLETHKIQTGFMSDKNVTKQPAYMQMKDKWHICWPLEGSENMMNNMLWIPIHPLLTQEVLDYMVEIIHNFIHTI